MNRTRMLTMMAIFVAIGTIGSIWFPARLLMAYPVQHTVNVMAAVILGTKPAVSVAFMIGLLRVLTGTSSVLAFPGGMIGAFLSGYLYNKFRKYRWAVIGEIIGTGVISSLFSVPFAKLLMGSSVGALFFMPSFLVSSITGSLIGWMIVARVKKISKHHI
ncbi:energy coupling factor transporter S component ThiW [Virgibacillus natechei]|uniref:energy coupling factor transporter S component ThiW n=1 Tax=Virgibacillus TaxID=84406 RepID=UPI001F31E147|nr:energy coupling factor transporter S component ThiW [Virgibacillus sp. NKC19-16]UJL46639.1 energy coupling factor transporter S component ThiW [Virgibacillus sp. NKC19-16]